MFLDISIIIPTFNRKNLIVRCLQAISQEFEVVVVDDGSTDGTNEAIEQIMHPRLKYIRQQNGGPAAARNTGISHASGAYIAFTDDDCVPYANWPLPLAERIEREGSHCAGVGGRVLALNDSLFSRYYSFHKILDPPQSCSYLVTANCLFRSDILHLVEGFDSGIKYPGGEDAGLSLRVRELGYTLAYEPNGIVFHEYRTGIADFVKTFYRYGKGCAHVLGQRTNAAKFNA